MGLLPVADSKIFIGDQTDDKSTDFVAADLDGLTYVEVDGWETMGGVGDTATLITTALINRGRDIKQKGTSNGGSMENQFAIVPGDAGQVALRAAAEGGNKRNYAFKIEFPDKPNENVGSSPTTLYFVALAMSAREVGGSANTIMMLNGTLEINSNVVIVDAVAA